MIALEHVEMLKNFDKLEYRRVDNKCVFAKYDLFGRGSIHMFFENAFLIDFIVVSPQGTYRAPIDKLTLAGIERVLSI